MKLFRDLNHDETIQFQQWARAHYEPLSPIDGSWHPAVQAECVKMNQERGADLPRCHVSLSTINFKPGNA